MTRHEQILERLCEELGFASDLVGGARTVVAQIDRFLRTNEIPDDLDLPSHPALWHRLIAEVVVPETSFFRYPESFLALREWTATNRRSSTRILCLPCSTGEEAWSIAMTFRETGITNFQVEAIDASSRSTAHAKTGRYAERSVRGLPPAQRERWFDAAEGFLTIASELRSSIDFRTGNAFSFHAEPQGYDVIFCRNLLIYFDADNQRRLFERLAFWLHGDGILFLGPGESTIAASHGWRGTGHAMSFSFIRGAAPSSPPARKSPPPRKGAVASRAVRPPAASVAAPEKTIEIDWLERATEFADAGRNADAEEALEKFHACREASPASLLLRGILHEAAGNRALAEADYRKTLYLAPDHFDALLHLALLLENDGRIQAARPFRRRLDRLGTKS